jgi:hypothetical protein
LKFFADFPTYSHNFSGEFSGEIQLKDIMIPVMMPDSVAFSREHSFGISWSYGTRADIIASTLYQDAGLDWVLYKSNFVISPWDDLALDQTQFESVLADRYRGFMYTVASVTVDNRSVPTVRSYPPVVDTARALDVFKPYTTRVYELSGTFGETLGLQRKIRNPHWFVEAAALAPASELEISASYASTSLVRGFGDSYCFVQPNELSGARLSLSGEYPSINLLATFDGENTDGLIRVFEISGVSYDSSSELIKFSSGSEIPSRYKPIALLAAHKIREVNPLAGTVLLESELTSPVGSEFHTFLGAIEDVWENVNPELSRLAFTATKKIDSPILAPHHFDVNRAFSPEQLINSPNITNVSMLVDFITNLSVSESTAKSMVSNFEVFSQENEAKRNKRAISKSDATNFGVYLFDRLNQEETPYLPVPSGV